MKAASAACRILAETGTDSGATVTSRLLESLRDPMDRQVVGPAAVEEVVYRVLRSARGRVLFELTRHQTLSTV